MTQKKIILCMGVRLTVCCVLMMFALHGTAQKTIVKQFKIKGDLMLIALSRSLSTNDIDEFTARYNIAGIGLHQLIRSGKPDSIRAMGWSLNQSDPDLYVVTKPLQSYSDLNGLSGSRIIFTPIPTPDDWRVVGGNKVMYGYNDFKSGGGFRISGDTVFFILKGYLRASRVRLAGSFTNWQYGAFPMTRSNDGWVAAVKLKPGPYYYKFIINRDGWITDPDNKISENDGRGNENSVFYVPNKTFALKGYENAVNVFVAGNFNNWIKNRLRLQRSADGWQTKMYLQPGTYKYNYYIDGMTVSGDGQKIIPDKPLKFSLGDLHTFTLKGFENAKKVMLAGNFNDWDPDELYLKKTADGWEISYALGQGNYQYKFIVDGNWMVDPSNSHIVNDGKGNLNSYLIIGANYTFHLKGFSRAKGVNLAGNFNDWSPEGLPMEHSGNEWICSVHLAKGKHLYKFVVDGKWIRDPANPDWESDEYGNGNSIMWIE